MSFADALYKIGGESRTLRFGAATMRLVSSDRPVVHSKVSLGIRREPDMPGIPPTYETFVKQINISGEGAR